MPQDYVQAVSWHRSAAQQGNPSAQFNLGIMYNEGKGVRQDKVRAQMWANLAAAREQTKGGIGAARTNGSRHTKGSLDTNKQAMTAAEIAEAQRLSHVCRASHYKGCGEPGEAGAWRSPDSSSAIFMASLIASTYLLFAVTWRRWI